MAHVLKKGWMWAVDKPDELALKKFIGRFVKVTDDNKKERVVEIEELQGSLAHPTKFQVNSHGESFLISMLDFFAQMNGERISKEEIELFDQTMFEIRKAPGLKIPRLSYPGFKKGKS